MQRRTLTTLILSALAMPLVGIKSVFASSPAFASKTLQETIKELGVSDFKESKDITIIAPDIAENGAVVPFGASTNLNGVKNMALLVEKNPAILSALFAVNPRVDTNFQTRVKMGQSSDVYAVAVMADGIGYYAKKEIKVTLGGCGG